MKLSQMVEEFDKAIRATGLKVERRDSIDFRWVGDVEHISCEASFHLTYNGFTGRLSGRVSCSIGVDYRYRVKSQAYSATVEKGFDYVNLAKALVAKCEKALAVKAKLDGVEESNQKATALCEALAKKYKLAGWFEKVSVKPDTYMSGTFVITASNLSERAVRRALSALSSVLEEPE